MQSGFYIAVIVVLILAYVAWYLFRRNRLKKFQETAEGKNSLWNLLNKQVVELNKQGDYQAAIKVAGDSMKVAEKSFGVMDPRYATAVNNLATLYRMTGDFKEAEALYLQAKTLWEIKLGSNHPHLASTLNNLADLYIAQERYNEAEILYNQALKIFEKQGLAASENYPILLENMAFLFRKTGREDKAVEFEEKARQART